MEQNRKKYIANIEAEHTFSSNLKKHPKIEGTEILLWQVDDFLRNPDSYQYTPCESDPYAETNYPFIFKIKGVPELFKSTLITAKWAGLILTGSMILWGIIDWQLCLVLVQPWLTPFPNQSLHLQKNNFSLAQVKILA